MLKRILPVLISLFLLVSVTGCGKNKDQVQDTGSKTEIAEPLQENEQAGTTPQVEEPASADINYDDLLITAVPDIPFINVFEVEPQIIRPGEKIHVSGHEDLSGTLEISNTSGETVSAQLNGGKSSFTVPDNWMDGYYLIRLSGSEGTLGLAGFRVASQTGIWLSANRSFITNDEDTLLNIIAAGLPEEALGAVYVRTQPDGPAIPFVPDEQGILLPGAPVPVTSLTDRILRLSSADSGELFVHVEPAEMVLPTLEKAENEENVLFEGWVSNSLLVQACDGLGSITGSMGEEGYVNAVWANGEIRSASLYSPDGAFTLEVGPGRVMLQTITSQAENTPEINTTILEVGCGEQKTVAIQDVHDKKFAGSFNGGSGVSGESVQVDWLSNSQNMAQPAGSTSEICRSGIIATRVSEAGEENQELAFLAAIALKSAITRVSPAANIITYADVQSLINAAAEAMLLGDEEASTEAIEAVQAAVSTDFLINLNAVLLGGAYHLAISGLPLNSSDLQVRAVGQGTAGSLASSSFEVYTQLAEDFSHAAVCGSVEPERKMVALGEAVEITYTVRDLSDAGAQGALVSISAPACGRLDPDNGKIEGEQFQTTYTMPDNEYCVEELEFNAEWAGPGGTVKTKMQESIAHISPQMPEISLRVGGASGLGADFNIVSAVTLYEEYDVKKSPGQVPAFTTEGECGFVEGGKELFDDWFYARSTQPGKRAEAKLSIFPFTDLTTRISHPDAGPIDHFAISMQVDAYGVPVEDGIAIRGAWASTGTSNTLFAQADMQLPGTIYVINIENPGSLPVVPIITWNTKLTLEGGAGYSALVFYKVIQCGDKAGLESMEGFYANGQMLFALFDDEPGEPSGLTTLPRTQEDRVQIVLYITANASAASLRDDSDGIYLSSFGRLLLDLNVYLSQEVIDSSD